MSVNEALATALEEIQAMMELLGEDSFRASAHGRAARAVRDLPGEVTGFDKASLLKIDGIGPKLADKLLEFAASGRIKEHAELASKVPPGLLALLQVPGLGPKTIRAMWQTLGIVDVATLERAIADGTLLELPRMGQKAVDKIKASLAIVKAGNGRLPLGRAWIVAHAIAERLRELPGVERVEPAGSLRRGRDTVGDIDVLVAMKPGHDGDAPAVGEAFRGAPGVVAVLASGDTKSSVRVLLNQDLGRWKSAKDADAQSEEGKEIAPAGPSIQVDLRVLPSSSFGAALMYFTGSKEHNVRLRERALSMGMTLSEWGLFPEDTSTSVGPHLRGVTPVASRTEEEIYARLGVTWTPPECREDRGELDVKAWNLVELADIKAELHAHTTASDGSMEIIALVERAQARGFHTIAVTDHSQSSSIAGGLRPDRLRRHIDAVREVGARVRGIRVLAGSEVDIHADGSLDYDDELLAQLDIVVASPHAALTQDPAGATARMVRAASHPLVHVIGHPTGRLINRRAGIAPDMNALIQAAIANRVALEINAHWMRLDLRDTHVRQAVSSGALIAINCDVHEPADFDNLRFGVATARRGWLARDACVNAWSRERLDAWLAKAKSGGVTK
jgi:DNA polymerase (family 10)